MRPMRLTLTLSDDGQTFTIEHADAAAIVPAGRLLKVLPDEVKAAIRDGLEERAAYARMMRDVAEQDRADALERKKARAAELATLEDLAADLPAPPAPEPDDTPPDTEPAQTPA